MLQLGLPFGVHVSVISAPKLETLGCLTDVIFITNKLVFNSIVIQVDVAFVIAAANLLTGIYLDLLMNYLLPVLVAG
jgi:hypothetical protein